MKKIFASLAALLLASASAHGQVLTFEGIGNLNPIGNFYNGGAGPNYGIEFFGSAHAVVTQYDGCGGTGTFRLQPSGCTALSFAEGSAIGMNRVAGFQTGFSLFYANLSDPGSVDVWSGLNGTGSLLGTLVLPVTEMNGAPGCNGAPYCPFAAVGISFEGIALSVTFSGEASRIGFDDITFGSATPGTVVPEPSTYMLLAAGLAGLGVVSRRRRKDASR